MNLLMIPFHDWRKCEREGFRTRDAHFMQEFGRNSKVEKLLVINRPISLAEALIYRRNWRVKGGQIKFSRRGVYISQVGEKTFTLDVVVPQIFRPIVMRREWIPYIFRHPNVVRATKEAVRLLGMEEQIALLISAPLFVPIVRKLSPEVFVLDAQDNLLKHALYRTVPHLEEYYAFCQDHADFISANSHETANWLAQGHPKVVAITNGVDEKMFDPSVPRQVPEDMVSIPGPVVGYAGKMQEMFDVPLLERAVAEMPHVSFVFIGQLLNKSWMHPLWKYPNTYYLGDKPYWMLAQYLSAFDICIIPYNLERQHGGDPIKFYEYLAMGKPIVTTKIGNVESFSDYPQVYIADSAEGFLRGLHNFVQSRELDDTISRTPLPVEHLWSTKANKIVDMITEELTA